MTSRNYRIHRVFNRLGFVFGTCYPFYFYDDYRGENRKIDFLEEPITAYEVGYSASDVTDSSIVHKVVDIAAKYHLAMDMFYHPVNVHRHPACRLAIEEALRYIDSKGIIAVHMGNDALWEWWSKRSRSQITNVTIGEQTAGGQPGISFTASCEYADGMIVKVPLKSVDLDVQPTCDGRPCSYETRNDFGRDWVYVIVPQGTHRVKINISERA